MGKRARAEERVIIFTGSSKRIGVFVNDAAYGIHLEGVTWPTVTHYMAAKEYPALEYQSVRKIPTATEVKCKISEGCFGRRNKWDVVRDDYLMTALRAKFSQHLDLESMLARTGSARLVYGCTDDSYYGIGPTGHGHNMLGRLLVKVRQEIGRTQVMNRVTCQQRADLAEAEEDARNNPENPDKLSDLANEYRALRMYERAIAAARRSVILDPDHEWGHSVMAWCLMKLDRHDEAIEPLKACMRLDPEYAMYYKWLAESCDEIGKPIQAAVYARRARLIEEEEESE